MKGVFIPEITVEEFRSASLEAVEALMAEGAMCDVETVERHDWILCSERMPEEHEWIGTKKFGTTISDEVYVTFENPKGERFTKHLKFQNGELSRYDKTFMDAWHEGAKPIAWKPLPEPYMGDA
jgi:hypothetical protein